ncbi:hypothetical protein SAMN04515679_0782 [Pelosinus fermentans]|uniref:hypothetical protein n=1 Tax=Pelosinus fermentans TaxID=365349 RepID=UPI0002685898|nr:hypothetical protein [Pelosinus fermentans]OAM92711.1 hypothetical protein FR7_00727 [Pelosinus fermentans DSM 17108]SDQ54496.1 hypothetical protein SAMN04515679_0782 [Pelosinus fermentans]
MRFYEPQRHNAADAAHKGEHKKNKNLCVLCVFVVRFVFTCFQGRVSFLILKIVLVVFLGGYNNEDF